MFRIEGDNVLFVFLPIIDRMEEPVLTEEFARRHPEDFARLLRMPGFILFRARKAGR